MTDEKRIIHADMPNRFSTKAKEGRLIVEIKINDGVELTAEELAHMGKEQQAECLGRMEVTAEIEVGDLKTGDIIGCDPDVYLENGIVAGILDALRNGIADRRGINIESAVEDAQEKADAAANAVRQIETIEDIANKMKLIMDDAEGSA